jgi:HSP20 family molecular chaperone IbpA
LLDKRDVTHAYDRLLPPVPLRRRLRPPGEPAGNRRRRRAAGYPPYNIERTDENAYRIDIAVAGFRPEELNVEVKENLLTVTGRKAANDDARSTSTAAWPSATSSAASSWPTTWS